MRRQKRSKSLKFTSFFEGIIDVFVKRIASIFVIFVFVLLVIVLTRAFLYRSDYFKLRMVETKGSFIDKGTALSINNQLLNLYKGVNLFKLNIKNIAQSIQTSYLDAKDIVVKIALPDKLTVNMNIRQTLAIVRGARYYAIDEEGVMLSSINAASLASLPIIEGITIRYDERRDKRLASKNIKLAIELLMEIKKTKLMQEYGVNTIEAGDAENLSFYLRNGIVVKIGYENFRERLRVLAKTLKDPRLIVDKVKYIDVRFKDVVIGPK